MIPATDGKIDFIQDHHHGDGDHCNRILQQGREIRLNSRYSRGKWEFIAKEQGGGQCLEKYGEETLGAGAGRGGGSG